MFMRCLGLSLHHGIAVEPFFSNLHHNNSAALAWGKYGCVALFFLFSRDHIRVLPLTVSRVPVVVPFPLFFCSRCRFHHQVIFWSLFPF